MTSKRADTPSSNLKEMRGRQTVGLGCPRRRVWELAQTSAAFQTFQQLKPQKWSSAIPTLPRYGQKAHEFNIQQQSNATGDSPPPHCETPHLHPFLTRRRILRIKPAPLPHHRFFWTFRTTSAVQFARPTRPPQPLTRPAKAPGSGPSGLRVSLIDDSKP
jgi:hypothetical protein